MKFQVVHVANGCESRVDTNNEKKLKAYRNQFKPNVHRVKVFDGAKKTTINQHSANGNRNEWLWFLGVSNALHQ